jgi:hypothetical protein
LLNLTEEAHGDVLCCD